MVEARLVSDSDRDDGQTAEQTIQSDIVYDAVLVPDPSRQSDTPPNGASRPWWKRHQRIILVGIIALALGIGLSIPAPSLDEVEPSLLPPEEETRMPTLQIPPLINGTSNVTYLGPFFESNCSDRCWPFVEMDGDTAVVAPLVIHPHTGQPLLEPEWSQQMHILHREPGGSFKSIQQIDVDYQPLSIKIFGDAMAVGAPWEAVETGAVYIYERDASGLWNLRQHIIPDDNREDAEFGMFMHPLTFWCLQLFCLCLSLLWLHYYRFLC